ncbi:hypothetical protein pdul_cds_202 [Pandoravirus dulcis]|uniref:Uncharacterized protein n=1 Tax=Pandoravirus dulcis TaxID=1349409 RepID=S4VVL8_9VIRU|nr:hypothetical protein pdul_cds_202 [Pandoravirus dulcis]AGO82141.1 hypothetical protein pdul_cds_202 [Pandoravirus dulcis]
MQTAAAATHTMPLSSTGLPASATPTADTPVASSTAPAPEPAHVPSGADAQTDMAVSGAIHDVANDDGDGGDDDDNDRGTIDDDGDSGEEEEEVVDKDDSDSDTRGAVPPRVTEEATGADDVQGANVAGTSRLVGRKRPRDHAVAAAQPMRKRHYVDSVRAVDGVRRHVSVTCTRLAVGGFKCTFTSEHRRLNSALRSQRANAKGGEVIERRHDAFLIPCAAGHDEPFPDYDRVRENFLVRGTDICEHVRSELIPIHSSKTATATTTTTTTTATAARSATAVAAAAVVVPTGAPAAAGDDCMDIPRAPSS